MVCGNITDERVWRDRDGSICGVYGDGVVDSIARLHYKVLWRYCLMILCDIGA